MNCYEATAGATAICVRRLPGLANPASPARQAHLGVVR